MKKSQEKQHKETDFLLLNFIKENRSKLNLEDFIKFVDNEKYDINAKDENGKNALHHLILGGGTFEFVRILIAKGIDLKLKDNNGDSPLDIVARLNNQDQLLMLLINAHKNQNLPISQSLKKKEKVKLYIELIEFEFSEENQLGEILKKLFQSNFDFSILENEEIEYLQKIKELSIIPENKSSSSESSDSSEDEKEEKSKKVQQNIDIEGFSESDRTILPHLKNFIVNFSYHILNRYEEIHKKITLEIINIGTLPTDRQQEDEERQQQDRELPPENQEIELGHRLEANFAIPPNPNNVLANPLLAGQLAGNLQNQNQQ